jgi:hypothetical protein
MLKKTARSTMIQQDRPNEEDSSIVCSKEKRGQSMVDDVFGSIAKGRDGG